MATKTCAKERLIFCSVDYILFQASPPLNLLVGAGGALGMDVACLLCLGSWILHLLLKASFWPLGLVLKEATRESKFNQETTAFTPCFHLPGFHSGYLFLTHSQKGNRCAHVGCPPIGQARVGLRHLRRFVRHLPPRGQQGERFFVCKVLACDLLISAVMASSYIFGGKIELIIRSFVWDLLVTVAELCTQMVCERERGQAHACGPVWPRSRESGKGSNTRRHWPVVGVIPTSRAWYIATAASFLSP